VLLFAKAPRAGLVKTRLAREIGAPQALDVYRRVGRAVADRLAARYAVTVWFDPAGAEAEMRRWLGDAPTFRPQPAGDLGQRLQHAVAWHFAEGDAPVVVVGADVPRLTAEHVAEAERRLGRHDVVIGPAEDGGYYLIGLTAPVPEVFRDMPWGSADVLRLTVGRCRERDLRVAVLETLRDVDTATDVQALGLARP
jgi:hypothetical protein